MLSVTALSGGGGGSAVSPPSIVYVTAVNDAVARTTYTFSSVSLGVAAPDRKVVVMISTAGATNGALNTVTVAGGSATSRAYFRSYSTISAIYDIELASGTSGDIVVTFASGKSQCGIGVYNTFGFATGTPSDNAFPANANPAINLTMTIPAGGGAIATARSAGDRNYTWVGLTEDFDQNYGGETQTQSGASDIFVSAESERTITATIDADTFGTAVVYAPA
jgi:hypothetical protein